MNDLVPVLQAIGASLGAIVVALAGLRRIAKANGGTPVGRIELLHELREKLEVEQAKVAVVTIERDEARTALASTRHDFDDCVRQRDDAFSELRTMKRRRAPRDVA